MNMHICKIFNSIPLESRYECALIGCWLSWSRSKSRSLFSYNLHYCVDVQRYPMFFHEIHVWRENRREQFLREFSRHPQEKMTRSVSEPTHHFPRERKK